LWRPRGAFEERVFTGKTSRVKKVEIARPPITVMARLEEMSWLPSPARPKAKGKRAKRLAKAVFVSKSTPEGANGGQGDGQEDEREREETEEDNQDQVHRSQGDDDGEKEIPEALLDVLGLAPTLAVTIPGGPAFG
jgi:hypothetical protein